jgi:Cof subfamily protein (haloacid dehalogenase superfamily)
MSESNKPFDLVVLDLDGTIIHPYRATGVTPRVVDVVARVQAAGVPVTIGTGRTLVYVREHINHLGVTLPVITTQGALIGDPVSGQVVAEIDMPLEPARQLAAWLDETDRPAAFYFSDKQGGVHIIQNRLSVDPEFDEYALGKADRFQSPLVELFAAADARPPIKCIMVNDSHVEPDIEPLLQAMFDSTLTITRTHEILVESTAPGVDKGEGLRRLCALLDISPARVLAIGDSENDIPMLTAAGYGVAMGNAAPRVKAVADWIAPDVDNDGAAVAMEKLILDA